jgi:hypothetical protein
MKGPWLMRFLLSGLQDNDAVEKCRIKRTHVDDPCGIEERLKELDA